LPVAGGYQPFDLMPEANCMALFDSKFGILGEDPLLPDFCRTFHGKTT
jgi:hypothetical protein